MENKKGKLGSRLAGSEAFLSVAASLICIVIGLLLGLVVLAIINAEHAFGDGLFSGGEARALCVGGICQQRQHTLAAILGNRGQVGHGVAGQRRVVDLEVACMHYHACRRMHCHCAGIGD